MQCALYLSIDFASPSDEHLPQCNRPCSQSGVSRPFQEEDGSPPTAGLKSIYRGNRFVSLCWNDIDDDGENANNNGDLETEESTEVTKEP